jgi:sulfite exporter TauE/SafE
MSTSSTEKFIWPLIFVGLFIGGLGFTVARSDDTLGWVLNLVGSVLMLVGALMLWARSRARSKS